MGATLLWKGTYTAPNGIYTITFRWNKTEYVSVGDKNGPRHAPYHRLDLSFTYKFDIGFREVWAILFNFYNKVHVYKEFEVVNGQVIN